MNDAAPSQGVLHMAIMPPLTGLYPFAGEVLQLCRASGVALRVW